MSVAVVDIRGAAQDVQELRGEVCSEPWIEAIIVPGPDGLTWQRDDDLYPPGGDATRMRECGGCGRRCPPNGAENTLCCDCQTEAQQQDFQRRQALLPEIAGVWWPSHTAYDPACGWWYTTSCMSYRGLVDQLEHALSRTGLPAGVSRNQDRRGDAADSPLTSDEMRPDTAARSVRTAIEIALERLNPEKKEPGIRAIGCRMVLLSESEKGLRREIAYFRKKGRIRPSARRYTHRRPYGWAPEDLDPGVAGDGKPDTQAPRRQPAPQW